MILKDILVNALFAVPAIKRRRMRLRPDYNPDETVAEMLAHVREKADLLECHVPGGVAGKTVLEVGPGGDFGLEIALVARGAARTICIDRDPYCLPKHPERVTALYQALAGEFGLPPAQAYRSQPFWHPPLPPDRFAYLVGKGIEHEDRIAPGSVDVIASFAVLEHLHRLGRAFAAMARLLKPGGWMVHDVDLRDHTDFNRPLDFLRYPPWLWNIWRWNLSYMNRLRWPAYEPLLKARGFRLERWWPTRTLSVDEVARSLPPLARPFRRLTPDQLTVLGVRFVARRMKTLRHAQGRTATGGTPI